MRDRSRYFIAVSGAVVMVASFVGMLELQVAFATSSADIPDVNRGSKGDRLLHAPRPQPPLPQGCEAKFSSLDNAYANEVAGRCLVMAPTLSFMTETRNG